MKTYEGVEVWLHAFLTSALYGSEWPVSCSSHFTPRKEPPAPIGWRLRVGLDAVAKKEILSLPMPGIEPWLSSPQPSH